MMYTIGMIHLGALIGAPKYESNFDLILNNALQELEILEDCGFDAAIIENFNDYPYRTTFTIDTVIQFTRILSVLKEKAKIKIGVNIQYSNSDIEMIVATICDADFIRVENFVEKRIGCFGELNPIASEVVRTKKRLSSNVDIYADINPKHTFKAYDQNSEYSIMEAMNSSAEYLIITGSETGKAPMVEDVEYVKTVCKNAKVIVGSGISVKNVVDFLNSADGIIVGSSIKINGDVNNLLDKERCIELIERLKNG